MDDDQRLTPLPFIIRDDHHIDYPSTYSGSYADTLGKKQKPRHYFYVVFNRLPTILALTLVITAAATFYSFRQPDVYRAEARIIIEPRKPQVALKDAVNIHLGDDQTYYKTQLELLQSEDLIKRVVIALGLHQTSDLFGGRSRGILSLFAFTGSRQVFADSAPVVDETLPIAANDEQLHLTADQNTRAKNYAKQLNQGFDVRQVNGTRIFIVTVDNPDPELAVKVAFKVAELFIEENAALETSGAQKAYLELGSSIEELKGAIVQQESDLISYMQTSGLPLQEKGQDLAASRLGGMSDAWLRAMETRRQLEARYNTAVAAGNRGQGMNIPDLHENKVFQDTTRLIAERRAKLQDQIRDIEKQIQEAETHKSELLVKYTPEYVKVQEMVQRVASLKATREKTDRDVSRIIDSDQRKIESDAINGALVALGSQLDAVKRQEAEAHTAYDLEASRANIQGQSQTKLTTLKREIETNRSLLDTYTQRQKEQELALSSDRPHNIKIQNPAEVPDEPVGPNRAINILLAFIASLSAGVGLAFLLDYFDDSVRNSDDVDRHLGLPTLALIPKYISSEKRNMLQLDTAGNGNDPSPSMVTLRKSNSAMAEAFKHLRTSLLFSAAGGPPQTILVTSPQPSEGKTTTAINIAITLAQGDVDVVIIDCDLRRPRIHSHFDVENSYGLTNSLAGDIDSQRLIHTFADLPRLKIITSGSIPPNPTELISSDGMRDLLRALTGAFKHVIIDSPPAIQFTDSTILSSLVDGVVLVAETNKSSIHLLREVKQRFDRIGARIYGVVLNSIETGAMGYDYYGTKY